MKTETKKKTKPKKTGDTIIRVSKKTVEWLKARAKYGDSYDSILQRELSIK